jgi:hypothetical protein
MTTTESRLAGEGKSFWQQYVNLNGYAFSPTEEGLKKLSRNLDVNIPWLRKCINLYLSA